MDQNINPERLAHNFLNQISAGNYALNDVETLTKFANYSREQKELPKHKVALLFICLNPSYWNLIKETVTGARKFFLPGHQTDFFLWSDIPKSDKIIEKGKDQIIGTYIGPYVGQTLPENRIAELNARIDKSINNAIESAKMIENDKDIKLFPTEPLPWPGPTLYRYHLFLQQEELLKEYDYVFYCDIDMRFVNYIGDEVIPQNGLMAAQHPMYALKKQLWPPYEPNPKSTAYIKRPGKIVDEGGKPRFMPLYYAGGFQGGNSAKFIEMAKAVSKMVDDDENKNNYKAIWNDESYWNRYLTDTEPEVVLTPSFIYPDSLIKEYYEPIWGTSYPPKLVTLTKDWSIRPLSEEEQKQIKQN